MTTMNLCTRIAAIVSGVLLLSFDGVAGAAEFMTPEYARAEYRPKSMVLVPPLAEVRKDKVSNTEQMIEEGAVLEDATALVLKQQLRELGYDVRVLSVDEVNAHPDLQLMVRNLNERFDADLGQVQRKPKDVRSRRFNFGDEARILAARLDADAILLSRVHASGATGGQKTMAVLFGGSIGYAAMNLSVVAGDNGDLEAYFDGFDNGMSPQQISEQPVETMSKVTAKVLKDYPAYNATATVRKSWPQSTDRKSAASPTGDAEVLSELEALFEGQQEAPAAPEQPVDE